MHHLDPIIPDSKYEIWRSDGSGFDFNVCLIDLATLANVSSTLLPSELPIKVI